jgi:transposase-like protein
VGFDAVDTESAPSWKGFLRSLRRRGVHGVKFVTSDDHGGLVEAIAEVFPGTAWQRCIVHLERDVAGWFSSKSDKAVALAAMKAVFAESDPKMVRAAYRQACEVVRALSPRCAELLEDAEADALAYLDFPAEHHAKLRTNNVQERANAEIKRRTKVVGVFPSEKSMLRLVGSVLLDVNEDWACGRFIDASTLAGLERDASDPEPPSAEVVELARKKIEAAIAERRAA